MIIREKIRIILVPPRGCTRLEMRIFVLLAMPQFSFREQWRLVTVVIIEIHAVALGPTY